MNIKRKTFTKTALASLIALVLSLLPFTGVFAEGQFSVSPMNQKIVLTSGETYKGSFKIGNPGTNTNDFSYKATVSPFYVDENYNPTYKNNGDYSQIVDWIKIDNPEGTLSPNSVTELYFTIDVPSTAPAGGQYAAINVVSNADGDDKKDAINLQTKYNISHIIYAEIAGTTRRQGNIFDANVPSFIVDGNITATSSIQILETYMVQLLTNYKSFHYFLAKKSIPTKKIQRLRPFYQIVPC